MCFLMHHANYCIDFEELQNIFNLQFDANLSLDSLEKALDKCSDEEFFILTEEAEKYKWYTEHSASPVRPIVLLSCRALPIEHRAYLAYHHCRGMNPADLKEAVNAMFPTVHRDSTQIMAQLNHFKNNHQLLMSLSSFSTRYFWNNEHKRTTGVSANSILTVSGATARDRLARDKTKSNDYHSIETTTITQRKEFR